MPVPKRRMTRSKSKMRSSTKHLKAINLSTCPRCQSPKVAHRVCMSCGYYKKAKVFQIEEE